MSDKSTKIAEMHAQLSALECNSYSEHFNPGKYFAYTRKATHKSCLIIAQNNEAVMKICVKVRSTALRHLPRTHRIDARWQFEVCSHPRVRMIYVNTKAADDPVRSYEGLCRLCHDWVGRKQDTKNRKDVLQGNVPMMFGREGYTSIGSPAGTGDGEKVCFSWRDHGKRDKKDVGTCKYSHPRNAKGNGKSSKGDGNGGKQIPKTKIGQMVRHQMTKERGRPELDVIDRLPPSAFCRQTRASSVRSVSRASVQMAKHARCTTMVPASLRHRAIVRKAICAPSRTGTLRPLHWPPALLAPPSQMRARATVTDKGRVETEAEDMPSHRRMGRPIGTPVGQSFQQLQQRQIPPWPHRNIAKLPESKLETNLIWM